MNLAFEASETQVDNEPLYHLNKMQQKFANAFWKLKQDIVRRGMSGREFSDRFGSMLVDEIEAYLHPEMLEVFGENPYKDECLDFVILIRGLISESKKN